MKIRREKTVISIFWNRS